MSARVAASWQTSLADLSLILFMIAAAALSRQENDRRQDIDRRQAIDRRQDSDRRQELAQPADAPASAAPLAVYLATPDAPPLGAWLARQAADPRQRLTVTTFYGPTPTALPAALAEAARLARAAGAMGLRARVVAEPGRGPARVALAFDDPALPEPVARSLLEGRPVSSEGISAP